MDFAYTLNHAYKTQNTFEERVNILVSFLTNLKTDRQTDCNKVIKEVTDNKNDFNIFINARWKYNFNYLNTSNSVIASLFKAVFLNF